MEKSKVYYCDFRTAVGSSGLTGKLKKLIQTAGIGNIDGRLVTMLNLEEIVALN